MPRGLTLGFLAALVLTPVSIGASSAQTNEPQAPVTVPIELRDNFAILVAAVNGVDVPLKFDLGDSTPLILQQSVLDRIKAVPTGEVAKFQGLDGAFETPLYTVSRLQIGDLVFTDVEARPDVRDPSYQPGASGEKGYLGTGLLKSHRLIVNYPQRTMTFVPPAASENGSCDGTAVPFLPAWKGQPVTEATTDFGSAKLWWDTGSPVSALSKAFAQGAPQESGDNLLTKQLVLGGTDFGPWQFNVWDTSLPGFDGFIGYDFFAKHVVCVDFPGQRLLIAGT